MGAKTYWHCCIGPADITKYRGMSADFPLRQALIKEFSNRFGQVNICSSGWGLTENQLKQISFATDNDEFKRATIQSYHNEKKNLPRHIRAWELLFQEEDNKKLHEG